MKTIGGIKIKDTNTQKFSLKDTQYGINSKTMTLLLLIFLPGLFIQGSVLPVK